jgi:hypothetical protein
MIMYSALNAIDPLATSTQGMNGHLSLHHAGRQKSRVTSPAATVVRQTRRRTGTVADDDESQYQMELPMNAVDTDVIDTGAEERSRGADRVVLQEERRDRHPHLLASWCTHG